MSSERVARTERVSGLEEDVVVERLPKPRKRVRPREDIRTGRRTSSRPISIRDFNTSISDRQNLRYQERLRKVNEERGQVLPAVGPSANVLFSATQVPSEVKIYLCEAGLASYREEGQSEQKDVFHLNGLNQKGGFGGKFTGQGTLTYEDLSFFSLVSSSANRRNRKVEVHLSRANKGEGNAVIDRNAKFKVPMEKPSSIPPP